MAATLAGGLLAAAPGDRGRLVVVLADLRDLGSDGVLVGFLVGAGLAVLCSVVAFSAGIGPAGIGPGGRGIGPGGRGLLAGTELLPGSAARFLSPLGFLTNVSLISLCALYLSGADLLTAAAGCEVDLDLASVGPDGLG